MGVVLAQNEFRVGILHALNELFEPMRVIGDRRVAVVDAKVEIE